MLLKSLVEFFNCGYVAKYKNRKVCEFIVTKINDIITYIIPFFDKCKIEGSKYKDYVKFKEAAILIKNKEHLTEEGLNKIIELKNSALRFARSTLKNYPFTTGPLLEPAVIFLYIYCTKYEVRVLLLLRTSTSYFYFVLRRGMNKND